MDDGQWLDTASAAALAFASRRLESVRVSMVLSVPDGEDVPACVAGARELRLGRLPTATARCLLDEYAPGATPSVRKRLLAEAQGNPMALAELPSALSDDQLTGIQALPDQLPLSEGVRQIFCGRVAAYGFPLLLAAAERDGDLPTLLSAAGDEDGAMDQLTGAARAGLITLHGQQVRFRHPLTRSATYQNAAPSRRRAAHRALADALDPGDDRRVWHLAAYATRPDDSLARLLANLADRTRHTGSVTTAVRALRRAATLSSTPAGTARWLVEAAECAWAAAEPTQARALLKDAESLVHAPELRARVARVRGAMLHAGSALNPACDTLMDSARLARSKAPQLAAESLLLAARAAWGANEPAKLTEIADLLADLALKETPERSQLVYQLRRMAGAPVPTNGPEQPGAKSCPSGDERPTSSCLGPLVWPPLFVPYLLGDGEAGLEGQRRTFESLRAAGAVGAMRWG
ncbi:hypothetical protein DWB77_00282 [Streptomyces hundungensis]|uniref:Uncharacterized protein n=1 Tax=Streptomyces hundungensis TaxID=1077946 RepID=A0A387H3B6_9ACTN|nr:hypothetical protein [Streptomyces hundungensis]AYG78175.1 hypothetical protein DWB77_00282 [Streptomyces hundungensis]